MYPSLTTFSGDMFAEFEAIQRRLQDLFGLEDWPSSIRAAARGAFPAVNIGSTDEGLEIYAFAPGLDPARIEVTVEKGVLTIAGERDTGLAQAQGSEGRVYARERFSGAFRRVIALPDEMDAERVDASYTNGVLRILIGRKEGMKPRRIEVKEVGRLEHKA